MQQNNAKSAYHQAPMDFDSDKIIDIAAIGCVGLIIFGSAALSNAVVISLMSVFAVAYILVSARGAYYGAKAWNLMMSNRVITDITFTVIFTLFFGTTIVGLGAAGSGGIFVSWFLNKQYKTTGFVVVPEKEPIIGGLNV